MHYELIILLSLLLCGVICVSYSKTNNKILATCLITLLIILILCYFYVNDNYSDCCNNNNPPYESFVNYAPKDYSLGSCGGIKYRDNPLVYQEPISYDGLILNSDNKKEYPLVSDVTIFSPVGDGIRLTEDPLAYSFPSVDGNPNSPKHLFMFANNQCRPECCPSAYSCDRGCVCTTEKQRELINKRWGNRTTDTYPNI